ERVAGAEGEPDLLEGIASLVDRSLLRESEDVGGEARFSILEKNREVAGEQLAQTGEENKFVRRHALEFARFAEEAGAGLRGDAQVDWFAPPRAGHSNPRAAVA